MNKEFFDALDMLEKEKGIPKEYMIERVEAALLSAYKKDSGGKENARVKLDTVKKDVKLFRQLTIVDEVVNEKTEISLEEALKKSRKYEVGDVYELEIKTKNFGRIAAQAAKQVIIQGIREAERGIMIKEYEEKKEEIVNAVVVRVDPSTGNVTLEIGKNEMVLFRHEQIESENLQVGDRIKVFITEIKKDTKGPSVVLSRVHPGLVRRLFELEVPEIKEGIVEIKSIAREAGSRTKIAVLSNDPNVDPIGACIGAKGSRKNNITAELCGEKIDIISYSEVNEEFISAALAPATVDSVSKLPDSDRAFRVIVADDQLSLAIGKEGQNARLAAKLTGFKIDIKSKKTLEQLA
ncbi:MAG: transcription termination/antitermination protein NusA [Clostridiales bacterium GWF2_36_10]|nr:MAG: transcription termination/antitermination protein NusA [Clostridiales bacterium GWF2_36_10]HAN21752.1 transcription termination/antitermination protein NusA [Clostridiales bacterium]